MGRIVDLPLSYVVKGIPARAQIERSIRVLDVLPVEIEEVTKDHLDLVLTGKPVLGHPLETRSWNGRLYSFAGPNHLGAIGIEGLPTRLRTLQDAIRSGRGTVVANPLDAIADVRSFDAGDILEQDITGLRSVGWSNQERRRTELEARAAGMLIVDGHLHLPAPDPVWTIVDRPGASRLYLHRAQLASNVMAFRFDRLDEARQYCERFVRGFAFDDAGVEQHMDWRWSFDEARHNDHLMLMELRTLWHQEGILLNLHDAPAEFFVAYCALRDAPDHASMIDAAERLEDAIGAVPRSSRLHDMLKPLSRWTWAQRALPDRRDAPSAEDLGDLRI